MFEGVFNLQFIVVKADESLLQRQKSIATVAAFAVSAILLTTDGLMDGIKLPDLHNKLHSRYAKRASAQNSCCLRIQMAQFRES
jgi:hypothetical protein